VDQLTDEFWRIVREEFPKALYRAGEAPPTGMLDWVIGEVRAGLLQFAVAGPEVACCALHAPRIQEEVGRYNAAAALFMVQLASRIWLAERMGGAVQPPENDRPSAPHLRIVR